MAKLFADSTTIALTSFISPYKADRAAARELHAKPSSSSRDTNEDGIPFVEVFVDVPVEVAESRDPKGLYKAARAGKIPEFTGISAPYEAPEKPEVHIKNVGISVEEATAQIVRYLEESKLLERPVVAGQDKKADARRLREAVGMVDI